MPGRIPWTVAARWCEVEGLHRDDLSFLWRCFAAMDEVYIRVTIDQIKSDMARPRGGGQ